MLVNAQATLTQLLYDHALRIRMKAETTSDSSGSRTSTAAPTPDSASIAEPEQEEGSNGNSDSTSTTAVGTDSGGKGKQKAQAAPAGDAKKAAEDPKDSQGKNLVGKINNLVTSDLNNITSGRDFMIPSEFSVRLTTHWCSIYDRIVIVIPCELAIGVVFLFNILGWR